MSKDDNATPSKDVSRREFLTTSVKLGMGLAGATILGASCAPAAAPTTSPTQATATSVPVAASPIAKGPVTLEFWQIGQGDNYDKVIKQAIQDFQNSHRNIKVNLSTNPTQDIDTKARSIFTSGGPGPDVVITGSVYSLTYANMPYGFIDLTDRIQAEGIQNKIPPSAWVTMTQNNRMFGIPFTAFVFLLNYNKDLYQQAGISGPPETMDELLANCKKINDPNKDRFGYLSFTAFPAWQLEQLWYDNGVGYFEGSENFDKYDITKPITITKPEAVAALQYVKSLAETAPGGLQGNIGVKSGDADAAFAKGNLAHYFTHTIHTSQIQSFNPKMVPLQNFDVAVFPKGSKRRGAMFSTEVIGITKGSTDHDAAWEFVSYLSGQVEGKIAPSDGTLPVRQDAVTDDKQLGSWLLPIGRQILAGEVFPQSFFPQASVFAKSLTSNEEAVFLGKKTAEQALADVAADAKKSLTP